MPALADLGQLRRRSGGVLITHGWRWLGIPAFDSAFIDPRTLFPGFKILEVIHQEPVLLILDAHMYNNNPRCAALVEVLDLRA